MRYYERPNSFFSVGTIAVLTSYIVMLVISSTITSCDEAEQMMKPVTAEIETIEPEKEKQKELMKELKN